jgi:predicted nuclease with RNAse H fold
MFTAGVDLAAEPKGTAAAVIEWSAETAVIRELHLGVSDDVIVDIAGRVNKMGIDCALGWPKEFIQFLTAQQSLHAKKIDFDGGMDWRRRLAYRETDRHVRSVTGRWPLSVATDRLGLTAMRCAGLLSKVSASGITIDRTGAGLVAEVYPGAALRLWGFDTTGYRVSEHKREELLKHICDEAPWLDLGDQRIVMVKSCDAFDAVIAALATYAVETGRYIKPTGQQRKFAQTEGWIALPQGTLGELILGSSALA